MQRLKQNTGSISRHPLRRGRGPGSHSGLRFALCMRWIFAVFLLCSLNAVAAEYQSRDDIKDTVEKFLRQQLEPSNHGEFEIHVSTLDQRLKLSTCDTALKTTMAPGAKMFGKTTVTVQCGAPKPWKIYVPANLVLYENVLAAARTIVRGEVLGAGDFTVVHRQVNSSHQGYFRKAEQAIGFVAKRSIPAGRVLTAQMVQAPRLVQRGQAVIILAITPQLEVRMKGKALSDGAKGDVVQVRNVSSQRVVEGIVRGAGVVEVNM
jgi:flagella basal body P-ring formation protein FlgA